MIYSPQVLQSRHLNKNNWKFSSSRDFLGTRLEFSFLLFSSQTVFEKSFNDKEETFLSTSSWILKAKLNKSTVKIKQGHKKNTETFLENFWVNEKRIAKSFAEWKSKYLLKVEEFVTFFWCWCYSKHFLHLDLPVKVQDFFFSAFFYDSILRFLYIHSFRLWMKVSCSAFKFDSYIFFLFFFMFYFFWFKKFDSMTIIFLNNSLSVSSHKHWV